LIRSDSNHNYADSKKGGKEIDQIIVDPENTGIKGGAVITAMDFSFRDLVTYRTEILCLDGCSQKAAQEAGKKSP
jgi:hypothetical protein